jgi:hypothetical protein
MIRTLQLTHLEKIITVLNGRKKIKVRKRDQYEESVECGKAAYLGTLNM